MIAKRGAVLLVRNPCRREYERFQLRNCKKLKKTVDFYRNMAYNKDIKDKGVTLASR